MTTTRNRMAGRKHRTTSTNRTQAMTRTQRSLSTVRKPSTRSITRSTEMNLMHEDLARAQIAARVETARRRRSVALLRRAARARRSVQRLG